MYDQLINATSSPAVAANELIV